MTIANSDHTTFNSIATSILRKSNKRRQQDCDLFPPLFAYGYIAIICAVLRGGADITIFFRWPSHPGTTQSYVTKMYSYIVFNFEALTESGDADIAIE